MSLPDSFWKQAVKVAADKWEAPNADRKLWRRKKDDGAYEYRELPPGEGDSQPQQEAKPAPQLKWVPDKNVKHIEPKHVVRLDKPLLHEVLSKGYFTVLSAGRNPNDPAESGMKEDDAYFHERHLALQDELEKLDAPYTEVIGHYGGRESSFIVFHDDTMLPPATAKSILVHYEKDSVEKNRKDMEALGEKFNQDSVLHGDNGQNDIAFTTGEKKGKNCGSRGWEEVPDAEDFFTDIELDKTQHTKVRLNIEDCFKRHLLSRMEEDMKLKYGNIPKGRFGKSDGIANVCLNKRYSKVSNRLVIAELVAQRVVKEAKSEQKSHS